MHLEILSELDRLHLVYGLLVGFEIGFKFALTGGAFQGTSRIDAAFGMSFNF